MEIGMGKRKGRRKGRRRGWGREREGEVLCLVCNAYSRDSEECNGDVSAMAKSINAVEKIQHLTHRPRRIGSKNDPTSTTKTKGGRKGRSART